MPTVKLFAQDGTNQGEVKLNEAVFGVEPNNQLIYDAVVSQRARLRQGTHATKTRGEVRGGGKKPWRQKGTGRARHGSMRSPIWVGGGVVFGPTPRSYGSRLPKKSRRLALKSILSQKVLDNELIVVDSIQLEQPKTKQFKAVLDQLQVTGKVLVVVDELTENIVRASNNLQNVKVSLAGRISVLDIISADQVVFTKAALNEVEEALQ
ncbi:50S ribosomal protein L4 [Allofustis seminis]|uniref:50S ribosomal protein L4 n=1 Tax=Allofustis seminis TaxID=166939 RepID=UPI0003768B31|nr:50S ribosomal protein L4 [Allofustis seminis]